MTTNHRPGSLTAAIRAFGLLDSPVCCGGVGDQPGHLAAVEGVMPKDRWG